MYQRNLERREPSAMFSIAPRIQRELHLGLDCGQALREWKVGRRAKERGNGKCEELRCATSEKLFKQVYL